MCVQTLPISKELSNKWESTKLLLDNPESKLYFSLPYLAAFCVNGIYTNQYAFLVIFEWKEDTKTSHRLE